MRVRGAQARDIPRVLDLSARAAGARAEVDDVVGDLDHLGLVLHDEHRVALVAQELEQGVHALDVVRVQARGRLVEDVADVGQRRAEVPDHLRALRLAARERARRAVEREVAEADVDERVDRRAQALHERGDLGVVDGGEPVGEIRDLHGRGIRDVHALDLRRPCALVQPGPVAVGAGGELHGAVDERADVRLQASRDPSAGSSS